MFKVMPVKIFIHRLNFWRNADDFLKIHNKKVIWEKVLTRLQKKNKVI
jgi:hypothetical protein